MATPEFNNKLETILKSFEDTKLSGYVPTKASSVTIGTGFDVGQHSEEELKSFGFPPTLIAKLAPYTNKKNKANAKNLKITAEEAELVDKVVLNTKVKEFEKNFEAIHNRPVTSLDENTRLALASAHFNMGASMLNPKKNPSMYKALQSGDNKLIQQQIANFHQGGSGQPISRRVVEAAIAAGDVNITPESITSMRNAIAKDSALRNQLTSDFNKNRTQLQPTSASQTDPSYQPTQRFEQIAPLDRVIPGGLDPSDVSGIKSIQRSVGAVPDGIWGPKSQAAYDSVIENRNQFAQQDPRRVDSAPQMAQASTEYASMEDLLMDRDLLGRSLLG